MKFGTKAETLANLRPLIQQATVPDLLYFSVQEWRQNNDDILASIQQQFSDEIIVRSSCLAEDTANTSMAGAFDSIAGVNAHESLAVQQAIESVIASFHGAGQDQVLIQQYINHVDTSGVIMTRHLDSGAPYYVFNYDDYSGCTDTITAGKGIHKTLLVHHAAAETMIQSFRIKHLLLMIHELEALFPEVPLDIEFGLTKRQELYLLQVRRISTSSHWNSVHNKKIKLKIEAIEEFYQCLCQPKEIGLGDRTLLSNMSDWNPAEILGSAARQLAISLYRELITKDVWSKARSLMGYRDMSGEELMITLELKPYIDVRNSFNSFLPADLDDEIGRKLVSTWMNTLANNNELHDKVEFHIVPTIADFCFDDFMQQTYPGILTADELSTYRSSLQALTKRALDLSAQGTLKAELSVINKLKQIQLNRAQQNQGAAKRLNPISEMVNLIVQCKKFGTLPFAVLARHGFIAERLLQSLIQKEALTADRVADFKSSFHTITHQFALDFTQACHDRSLREQFLRDYGHLRPGTYDIMSLSYADRPEIFFESFAVCHDQPEKKDFVLAPQEKKWLTLLLAKWGYDHFSPENLLAYCQESIAAREYAKFVFSRNVSELLEMIATWGKQYDLNRENLSFLSLHDILDLRISSPTQKIADYLSAQVEQNFEQYQLSRQFHLSYILAEKRDLYVVPVHRNQANYITTQNITEEVVCLDGYTECNNAIMGKIVCIESADPGFDWIFTRKIKGLITKFGGLNSHMAIRCAELKIPAAIGCGDELFSRIKKAQRVELDCQNLLVKIINEK